MQPAREQAHVLLENSGKENPGPWIQHSYAVAHCAERIAGRCGLDAETAYIDGLLHDIGRKYGFTYLRHTIDGYRYLLSLGYGGPARICITHVFSTGTIEDYIGKIDVTDDELDEIMSIVRQTDFDDYDLLIQLCDTLAGAEIVDMRERMADVERRYGYFPQTKRAAAERLKAYFEDKCGENIYRMITDDETLWDL